jgi:hypothetical protein
VTIKELSKDESTDISRKRACEVKCVADTRIEDAITPMGRALVIHLMLMLYEMVKKHEIDLLHKLSLADGPKAYDIFDKKEDGNIKVILKTYGGVK